MLDSDKLNLERITFLLVDDNPQALIIAASVLAGFGVRSYHKCGSVKEAREYLSTNPVDFLLTDAHMPEEDGYSLVRWLRRHGPEANRFIPVIVVTGHTRQSQVLEARDCGVHAVVAKPLIPRVLLERIFWVANDQRKFIECDDYVGPDRRLKNLGPPEGILGRRSEDAGDGSGVVESVNVDTEDLKRGAA
ncbi:MAG: response regulator [Alphaproteobacteria bacterium]